MTTIESTFENELGNAITISVQPEDVGGFAGILMSLSGPTSVTENRITIAEARVLHALLGTLLYPEA